MKGNTTPKGDRWRKVRVVIITEPDGGPAFTMVYSTNRLGKHMWGEAFWRGLCDPRSEGRRIVTISIYETLPNG